MVRHKVYVILYEYGKYGYIGETRMNAHHQKVEEVYININADTEDDYDLSTEIRVKPAKKEVEMAMTGGNGYIIDLTEFKGKILISPEQLIKLSSEIISRETS